MGNLPESARYEGVEVDLSFTGDRPKFGDLFTICRYENPNFPPSDKFDFTRFEELQFSQVDDYFGVQTLSGEGDDVAVWLYPLVKGAVVDHHPGPFDGIRLAYNVLRNPIERSDHFLRAVEELSGHLSVTLNYRSGSGGVSQLREDIDSIVRFWQDQGIQVGSGEALCIDH